MHSLERSEYDFGCAGFAFKKQNYKNNLTVTKIKEESHA